MTLYRASMWDDARIIDVSERTARVHFVYPNEPTVKTRIEPGYRFSNESPHPLQ